MFAVFVEVKRPVGIFVYVEFYAFGKALLRFTEALERVVGGHKAVAGVFAEYPAGVHASLGKFLEALVYDVPAVDSAAVVFREFRDALGERLFKIAPEIRHVFVELF